VPILNAEIRRYLKETVLEAYLKDNVNARVLRPDGSYRRLSNNGSDAFDSQMFFAGREIDL
jgi:polyphosphate kinase